MPELRFIGNYHDEPAYIDAIAASIREHWRTHERGHLLFSFHGVPRRYCSQAIPITANASRARGWSRNGSERQTPGA